MSFEFEYLSETVEIEGHVFLIGEVTEGEYAELQKKFFGDVALSSKKDGIERQLNQRRVYMSDFAQHQELLAIKQWTYKGENVPVTMENWRKLTKRITKVVDVVIERLNPSDSDEFQDGHGDGSGS